jgi:hypothetical protein
MTLRRRSSVNAPGGTELTEHSNARYAAFASHPSRHASDAVESHPAQIYGGKLESLTAESAFIDAR